MIFLSAYSVCIWFPGCFLRRRKGGVRPGEDYLIFWKPDKLTPGHLTIMIGEEGQAPDRRQERPLRRPQGWREQDQLPGWVLRKFGKIFHSKFSKDQYVDSDVNPLWNYEAHFPMEQPEGLSLQLEVIKIVIYPVTIWQSKVRYLTLTLVLRTTSWVKPLWKSHRWWRTDPLRLPANSLPSHERAG